MSDLSPYAPRTNPTEEERKAKEDKCVKLTSDTFYKWSAISFAGSVATWFGLDAISPKFKKYDFRLKSMAAAGIPLAIANFQAEHAMLHCKNEDAYRYQEMRKQRLRERELKAQEAAAAAAAAAGENKQ